MRYNKLSSSFDGYQVVAFVASVKAIRTANDLIEEVESQAKFDMRTLTKKARQAIASFLRSLELINQHLGSEVKQ